MQVDTNTIERDASRGSETETPLVSGQVEMLEQDELHDIKDEFENAHTRTGDTVMRLLGHITALDSKVSLLAQKSEELASNADYAELKVNFDSRVRQEVEKVRGQSFGQLYDTTVDLNREVADLQRKLVQSIDQYKRANQRAAEITRERDTARRHESQLQRRVNNIVERLGADPVDRGDTDELAQMLTDLIFGNEGSHHIATVNPDKVSRMSFEDFRSLFEDRARRNFRPGSFRATSPWGGNFSSDSDTFDGAIRDFWNYVRSHKNRGRGRS